MRATETGLLLFMSVRNQRFEIPIFQRRYSWTTQQCEQLWDDVLQVANDEVEQHHFIGSIIYIHDELYQVSTVKNLMVIDGQQRLTTVSLFLLALANNAETEDSLRQDIYDDYLLNKRQTDETQFKLWLTKGDRETFCNLVKNLVSPSNASNNIIRNYEFFVDQISKSQLDSKTLYQGIDKLLNVDVTLNREKDDPQRIFESLNSRGMTLSESDKIRNFVLLRLKPDEQERLYNRFWYPMEQRFSNHGLPVTAIDEFMRRYLTAKMSVTPQKRKIYLDFCKFAPKSCMDTEQIVEELYIYSRYEMYWRFPETVKDAEVQLTLSNLKTLDVDVAWPMLLNIFDDYERKKLLTICELKEILRLVENYVFRRAIVGIATNSLKTTFASLLSHVNKNDYLKSFTSVMLSPPWPRPYFRRFPNDDELHAQFVTRALYQEVSTRLPYLMTNLENFERKEKVQFSEYTIEHILPQNDNLRTEWQETLGDNWQGIHTKCVHTIGNLTLSGYNSELGDRPFLEKRDMVGGFATSPLWLNQGLGQLEQWGEKEIEERAERLYCRALKVWPYPQLNE